VPNAPQDRSQRRLLLSPADLQERLSGALGPPPLVIDLRPAHEFAAGQIPGAVHLDLWGVSLIDTDPAPLRAFLWLIEHQFALRGVTDDRPVVVYDDKSGVKAARAFWFLEYFGHPDVSVLDGGFGAWARAGLPVSREARAPSPSAWKARPVAERLATWHDVRDRIGDPGSVLLDTRSDAEYYGEEVRARHGGAVPGAVHLEWTRSLDAAGAFKTVPELRAMFGEAGVEPAREVVAYCQGGYRAAHSYLALRVLGFPKVRNYLGSWREWGDRDDLPITVPGRPGSA
jgi:thiosulfate/3-mercaptopyruvate sulfurtransferase